MTDVLKEKGKGGKKPFKKKKVAKRKEPWWKTVDLAAKKEEYTQLLAMTELLCMNANPEQYKGQPITRNTRMEHYEVFNLGRWKDASKVYLKKAEIDGQPGYELGFSYNHYKTGEELQVVKRFTRHFALNLYLLRRLQHACDCDHLGRRVIGYFDPMLRALMEGRVE